MSNKASVTGNITHTLLLPTLLRVVSCCVMPYELVGYSNGMTAELKVTTVRTVVRVRELFVLEGQVL